MDKENARDAHYFIIFFTNGSFFEWLWISEKKMLVVGSSKN